MLVSPMIISALMLLAVPAAFAKATVVENGKKVKFDYTLKVDGKVVESSEGKAPLEYLHGEGKIIPGLSSALEGMKVGQKKTVTVKPENAYGQVNPQAFMEIPKTSFPAGFKFKVGDMIRVTDPQGRALPGTIEEVKADTVKLNFNHPMAGKTLVFDVKIVSIE